MEDSIEPCKPPPALYAHRQPPPSGSKLPENAGGKCFRISKKLISKIVSKFNNQMSYWESLLPFHCFRRAIREANWLFAEILIAVSFESALQISRAPIGNFQLKWENSGEIWHAIDRWQLPNRRWSKDLAENTTEWHEAIQCSPKSLTCFKLKTFTRRIWIEILY